MSGGQRCKEGIKRHLYESLAKTLKKQKEDLVMS